MIIFGTRGITTTPSRGAFFCPSCNTEADYELKRVRRFFTLYFLPVIPMDKLGDYVKCTRCQGEFNTQVLAYDALKYQEEAKQDYSLALRVLAAKVLVQNNWTNPDQIARAVSIFRYETQMGLDEQELSELVQIAKEKGVLIEHALHQLPELTDQARETLIRLAAEIARMGNGQIPEPSLDLISKLAMDLGMSPAHLRGVLHHSES